MSVGPEEVLCVEVAICENSKTPIMGAIQEGLEGYTEAYLVSAFMTGPGLQPLMDQLTSFAQSKRHKLTLVTGDYLAYTSWQALADLRQLEQESNGQARSERVRLRRIQSTATSGFHPKMYLFCGGGKALLLVGSANLTSSGIADNVEAYVRVSGGSEAEVFRTAKQMILEWGGLGEAVTDSAIEEQKAIEERRRAQEELMSLIRPMLGGAGRASNEDFLGMCDFVRRVDNQEELNRTERMLLTCLRQGRIVELHLSHSGIWLPFPAEWFNADKQHKGNQKMRTKTTVDYDIFGKETADQLRKLENRAQFGMDQFGWRTCRGVFVPDCMWDRFDAWFTEAKARYTEAADAALGPTRGMRKRAEDGLRDAVEATWRLYNRGKPLPRGLIGDVRGAVATRVQAIASKKRKAWRFEMSPLPHPVVAWSATPAALSGIVRSEVDTADDLADFALSNLQWLARRLRGCAHQGPKECRTIAEALSQMNVLRSPGISEAASSLAEAALERAGGRLAVADWDAQRLQLAAQGQALLDRTQEFAGEEGPKVIAWLEEAMLREQPD